MARRPRDRQGTSPAPVTIMDLVSYRVARTASLMSRGAAMRYRREFGVNLGEWRALALLAVSAPQSLVQLSRAAGLDKAQMSRVVASLIERGLVSREPGAASRRLIELTLTTAGERVYAGLIAAAASRDQQFRRAVTPQELLVLEHVLAKLSDQARHLINEEAALQAPQAAP